jgi:hypothetical protein
VAFSAVVFPSAAFFTAVFFAAADFFVPFFFGLSSDGGRGVTGRASSAG